MQKTCHLSLFWVRWIFTTFHHISCRSILIFPLRLGFASGLFEFSHQNRVCIFLSPHPIRATSSTHLIIRIITSQAHCMSSASCIAWSTHSFEKCFKEVRVLCHLQILCTTTFFFTNATGFLLYMRQPRLYIRSQKYIYSTSVTYSRRYNYSAGSKREPKLVACKLILRITFVVCDGHWINISLWKAARLHSCFVKSRLVCVTTDRLERKLNSSDGV